MARRKMPRRDSKGRFVGGGRKTTTRKRASRATTAKRSTTRRRTYRRNPPARDIVGKTIDGVRDAAYVLGGKATARIIPEFLSLPQAGPMGLAIQGLSAIGAGMLFEAMLGRDAGRLALAGGLSAPLESVVKAANIPYLSNALSAHPTRVGGGGMGRYVQRRQLSRYVQPRQVAAPSGDPRASGLARYHSARRR